MWQFCATSGRWKWISVPIAVVSLGLHQLHAGVSSVAGDPRGEPHLLAACLEREDSGDVKSRMHRPGATLRVRRSGPSDHEHLYHDAAGLSSRIACCP